MNELLSALDESVFTPELSQKVTELFESKIAEVQTEAAEKILEAETKSAELAEKLVLVEAKAEEFGQALIEKYETKGAEYEAYMLEQFEAEKEVIAESVKAELAERMDSYLKLVAEEFVEENKIVIDESVKAAKVDAILEGFDSLLITAGVELSSMVEAKQEGSKEAEFESLKKSLNKVIAENAKLKSDMENVIKEGIYSKYVADMSIIQKDTFAKLVEMVPYSDSESFEAKVKTIAETVSKKEIAPVSTVVTESVTPDHKRYF